MLVAEVTWSDDDTDRDHQSDERDQNAEDVHDPTTTTEDDPQTHIDYSKVFISEDLTRHRQYILWRARSAKRNKKSMIPGLMTDKSSSRISPIKLCWSTP